MKSHTLKTCIILAVLILVGAGAFGFLLMIVQREGKVITEVASQTEEKNSYAEADHSLQNLIQDSTPALTRLSSRVVTADGTVSFIEMIENLAKQNGLTVVVNSIGTSDTPKQDGYQWMTIALATQGSWQANNKYLVLLENLPYKINLGGVSFNQTQATVITGQGKNQKAVNQSVWNGSFSFNVLQEKI